MTATIEKPRRKVNVDSIGQEVLKRLGYPPSFNAVVVCPLWSDKTSEFSKDAASFYRVNIYVNVESTGMVQRVVMSDSFFVKCVNDDLVTEISRKYEH